MELLLTKQLWSPFWAKSSSSLLLCFRRQPLVEQTSKNVIHQAEWWLTAFMQVSNLVETVNYQFANGIDFATITDLLMTLLPNGQVHKFPIQPSDVKGLSVTVSPSVDPQLCPWWSPYVNGLSPYVAFTGPPAVLLNGQHWNRKH